MLIEMKILLSMFILAFFDWMTPSISLLEFVIYRVEENYASAFKMKIFPRAFRFSPKKKLPLEL